MIPYDNLTFYRCDHIDLLGASDGEGGTITEDDELCKIRTSEAANANMVGSMCADNPSSHYLLIDIDHPVAVVPTSTDGHFHLIILPHITKGKK